MVCQGDVTRAYVITVLFTAVIATTYAFGVYLLPLLIPDMRRSLGFTYAEIGLITGARQVAFLLTSLVSAAAVLRFGAGAVIVASTILCGTALCGMGVVGSVSALGGLLVVLNACAASAWIPMVSLVAKVVSYRHQGKTIGLIASGTNYGLCLNGVAAPLLLAAFGWRAVWFTAGGFTLVLSGFLWRALARASLLGGATSRPARLAGHWHFAFQRRYGTVLGIAFLGGLVGVPSANYLSAYLREDLRLSAGVAGDCWLAMGLAGALGGVLFGSVGDKAGLRVALAAAASLLAASAMVIAGGSTPAPLVFATGLFGGAFFSMFGLLPAYIGKTADACLIPAICGLVECSLGAGGAVGSFLGGLSPQLLGSFRPLYVGAALISCFTICLAFRLQPERRP